MSGTSWNGPLLHLQPFLPPKPSISRSGRIRSQVLCVSLVTSQHGSHRTQCRVPEGPRHGGEHLACRFQGPYSEDHVVKASLVENTANPKSWLAAANFQHALRSLQLFKRCRKRPPRHGNQRATYLRRDKMSEPGLDLDVPYRSDGGIRVRVLLTSATASFLPALFLVTLLARLISRDGTNNCIGGPQLRTARLC